MFKAIIVDDEHLVIKAIKILGEWESLDVEIVGEFSNGSAALNFLQKNRVDIVLLDMCMPLMNGAQLLREIDQLASDIKVIAISAHSDFEYMIQAIRSKVIDYLQKPIDAQNLNEALSQAVLEIQEKNELVLVENEDYAEIIENIEKYLRKNFKQELSLKKISEEFFLSREYISRLFKKKYGVTIVDYISKLRINRSKVYLINSNDSIQEIAFNVGYSSGNYFSKVFTRIEKKSPTEYRNENAQK